jgi:hypothetical protein
MYAASNSQDPLQATGLQSTLDGHRSFLIDPQSHWVYLGVELVTRHLRSSWINRRAKPFHRVMAKDLRKS